MARGVNKVFLIGTLGADPDVRFMPNGNAVANISLATNDTWKDKQTGQAKEKTEWHRVVVFGKLAEIAGEYLRKGSSAYFEGKLQTRKWQDQATGVDKFTTEVVIDFDGQMQMLGGNTRPATPAGGFQQQQAQQPMQQQAPAQQPVQNMPAHFRSGTPTNTPKEPPIDFDDDIPFDRLLRKPHSHLVV